MSWTGCSTEVKGGSPTHLAMSLGVVTVGGCFVLVVLERAQRLMSSTR